VLIFSVVRLFSYLSFHCLINHYIYGDFDICRTKMSELLKVSAIKLGSVGGILKLRYCRVIDSVDNSKK
jgi:hypothetical protein